MHFFPSLSCWLELKELPVMTALLDMTGMTGVTCKRKFPLLSSKGCPIVNMNIYFVEMVPVN